jgi:transforming growth factor-beta-induced protein
MNLKTFLPFMQRSLLVVVLITTIGLTGCDDDEEPAPTKTIWELVQENPNLTKFEAELEAAGLDDQLAASGTMTLFAPSDAALTNLLTTLGLENFESVSNAVADAVLSYHIANSQYLADALTNNLEISTVQGEKIKVVTTSTGEKTLDTGATSDSKVTTSNIKATNGVIHIVDVVLVPPTIGALIVETLGTVAQPLLLASDFTILAQGIQKANAFATAASISTITDILINEAPGTENFIYTVFAPTNATFQAGGLTADSFNGETWYGLILNHVVVSSEAYGGAEDFSAGGKFTTLATGTTGIQLTVLATNAPTNPNAGILTGIVIDSNDNFDDGPEAQIAVLDVLTATGATPAQNGVVNVIAGVLSPQ